MEEPDTTSKALGAGAFPPVQALDAVTPGVMVRVQEPPFAANGVPVLQVVTIVTSEGRFGVKSE